MSTLLSALPSGQNIGSASGLITQSDTIDTFPSVTANTGASYEIDPNDGVFFYLTMNSATPAISFANNPVDGMQIIYLFLQQDATGGRDPSFSNVTYDSGSAPTIDQAANAVTALTIIADTNGFRLFAALQNSDTITLAGATFTEQAGLQAVGRTDGLSTSSGYVGEIQSSTLAIGSATSLTTATAKTITSVSLTAGKWRLWGNVGFIAAAGTLPTLLTASISTTNNTQATSPNGGAYAQIDGTLTAASTNILPTGSMTVNISSTTTYYLVATATFTVSTLTGYGFIGAERLFG